MFLLKFKLFFPLSGNLQTPQPHASDSSTASGGRIYNEGMSYFDRRWMCWKKFCIGRDAVWSGRNVCHMPADMFFTVTSMRTINLTSCTCPQCQGQNFHHYPPPQIKRQQVPLPPSMCFLPDFPMSSVLATM
jgi:hypothetical protein